MAHAWLSCGSLKGIEPMETIPVEMLREWLAEGRPVTILDVRPAAERLSGTFLVVCILTLTLASRNITRKH